MWGAEDMIGNVWEWVAWWGQAGRDMSIAQGASASPWPVAYNGDYTWNINGEAHNGTSWATALPAAALRGGYWNNGANAGVFAVDLGHGPSNWYTNTGFRCCRRR